MTIDNPPTQNLNEAVSVEEAGRSLEALANLLFLCSQAAGDSGKVTAYVQDAEQCVLKLTRFIRGQMVRNRRTRDGS
jgi:hypothetical protein